MHTHPEQWARGEQSGVRCTHTAGAVGARGAVGHSVHTHTRSSGRAGSSRGFGAHTHPEQWARGEQSGVRCTHTAGAVGARGAVGHSVHTHTRSSGHAGSSRGFGAHTHPEQWACGKQWGVRCTHIPGAVGTRGADGGSVHTYPEQWARGEQTGVRYTHTRSSGRAGSSRGFGAQSHLSCGIEGCSLFTPPPFNNSCWTRDLNPQPQVTSSTLYPLGHNYPTSLKSSHHYLYSAFYNANSV